MSASHIINSSLTPTTPTAVAVPTRKRSTKPSEVNLLKLASIAGGFETKKAAQECLKNAGFIATPEVVGSLLRAVARIRSGHNNRPERVVLKRLGHIPERTGINATISREPVLLPKGEPTIRLISLRKQAVTAVAYSLIRHGAAGGHSLSINFAPDASAVDYKVVMDRNWNTYRGQFKGWSADEDHHRITVPLDWRLRVERKGLADLGGMMTLDAHELMPHGDVQLFAATWARQGRGFDVKVDRGFMALLGGEHFHADSAKAAISGVQRKVKAAGLPARAVVGAYELSVEGFIKRYQGRNISVSVCDAQESGSCDFGIRSWCEAVGLNYEGGEAPLEMVLQGFRARPQEEVRRAVLYAVRRHRAKHKGTHRTCDAITA